MGQMEAMLSEPEQAAATDVRREAPFGRVLAWLAKRDDAVLLRPGPGAGIGDGGDLDILASDPAALERGLDECLGVPDLRIARRYVIQRYYPWGQVDILPRLEWNGVAYADPCEVLAASRRDSAGVRRPAVGHDAYISWMTSLLWGGFYKEKYDDAIRRGAVEDGAGFEALAGQAFGAKTATKLLERAAAGRARESQSQARTIRWALVRNAFLKRPLAALAGIGAHWWTELRWHLRPPMPMIGILGPDGSGKSTVIEGVMERLAGRRIASLRCHWRPRLLGQRLTADGGPVSDPHGKPPRGNLASLLKLLHLAADWHVGHLWPLRHARAKGKLVIFDRYYDDLLVDPRRYRFDLPAGLAAWWFRWFPKMDGVVVLWAPPEVIQARKLEVSRAELERQLEHYRGHAERLGGQARLVRVDRPVGEIVDDVMEWLEDLLKRQLDD